MSGDNLALLQEVIAATTPERLESTFLEIVVKSTEARKLAAEILLLRQSDLPSDDSESDDLESDDSESIDSENSDSESDVSSHADGKAGGKVTASSKNTNSNEVSSKRPRVHEDYLESRYAVCEQCDEEFDKTQNFDGACVWHEGELEADRDSDFWADHDEYTHGPIDTQYNRKNLPEGFIWSCCEKEGNEVGCEVGRHMAKQVKRRKTG